MKVICKLSGASQKTELSFDHGKVFLCDSGFSGMQSESFSLDGRV